MGIVLVDDQINVPKMFHSDDRGYFVRACNGTIQQIGINGIQNDISKTNPHHHGIQASGYSGALTASPTYVGVTAITNQMHCSGIAANNVANYDSRAINPVEINAATETRPLTMGLTPAIFLGV